MELFHTAAFIESKDSAGVFSPIAAPLDSQLTVVTPDIRVPELNHIVLVAGGIEVVAESFLRLSSPSLRIRGLFQVEPFNVATAAAVQPMDPHRVHDLRRIPLPLIVGEQLNAETNSNPAAVQYQWCIVWFAAGPLAVVEGKIFTVRATGATALVAAVWTPVPLTFVEDLPRGRYQVVGMRARSATCVAARLAFVGGAWRPGVLGVAAQDDLEAPLFRYGGMGPFGEFEDTAPPVVDFLATAADAAEDVYLDLIQLREGPG